MAAKPPLVPMQGKRPGRYYRLPSGVVTDDRVAWDGLDFDRIAGVIGAGLLHETRVNLEDVQVVRWEHVREDLADVVRTRVRSHHAVLGLSQEDLGFRPGWFSPVVPGQWVVLLTGSILTGATATTILRVLRRMEADPLAVATVIDGRVDCGAPIATFGGAIPVISCLQRTLVVGADTAERGEIIDVDLRGRQIVEAPRRIPEVTTDRFLAWLAHYKDSGVYLGHIERRRAGNAAYYRRARHFSTYVHMGALVADHDEPKAAVKANVHEVLGSHLRDTGSVRVLYPATDGDIAGKLARAVADELDDELDCDVSLIAARRGSGGAWGVADGPWDEFTAIIVDWGAVTTATVRALMALAVRNGATRIHAVVLTSQMEEQAETDLTAMSMLRGDRLRRPSANGCERPAREPQRPDGLDRVQVPVSAAFLSRVPMGMATIPECHLCHLAHEFRRHSVEAPTRLLREHARAKFELYQPISRREVLKRPATDLVGTALQPGDAIRVWELHQLLEDAHNARSARMQVRDAVLRLAGPQRDPSSFEAWMRLLTVEPYWLNRAPLSSPVTRDALAQACIDALTSSDGVYEAGTRWQAAIVLRVASKRAFLDRFAEVVLSVADDRRLAAESCYGMLTLLERPYNRRGPILKSAVDALHYAREPLSGRRTEGLSRDLLTTLSALHRRARELLDRSTAAADDPLAPWRALQRRYVEPMRKHAGVLTSMLIVLNALSGPSAEQAARTIADAERRSSAYWTRVFEAWSECWDYLATAVFPYLHALRDLLESLIPELPGAATLLEFDDRRAALLSDRLRTLERYPAGFMQAEQAELELEAFDWFNALLRGPEPHIDRPHDSSYDGALLLRLIEENPSDLAVAWRAAVIRARGAGLSLAVISGHIPAGLRVFARQSLLTDVFVQILENAARTHIVEDCPDAGIDVEIGVTRSAEMLTVSVKNNWSHSGRSDEGGLTHFGDELSMFGAVLSHAELASPETVYAADWTFEVSLELRRWRERN